jgi:hypothetical protein
VRLAELPDLLSIEDQVRVDVSLYQVGVVVRILLHENGLQNQDDLSVRYGGSRDAPPMAAAEAKKLADELSNQMDAALTKVRKALCWNSWPPSNQISDERRKAIARENNQRPAKPTA